ncbi:MAG: diguanylate cyclase [Cyanobacteria bacterium P01_H01_bin.15]
MSRIRPFSAKLLCRVGFVSIGIAIYPEQANNGLSLLRAANRALYQAKTEGHDRVITVV